MVLKFWAMYDLGVGDEQVWVTLCCVLSEANFFPEVLWGLKVTSDMIAYSEGKVALLRKTAVA